jgi:predicted metal-dependent peptidase
MGKDLMADLDSADKKIERVLINWFTDDSVMLNTFCLVNRVPDPRQETMGIDVTGKVPTIKYNPNFVNSLPVEHLEMVMASEGFKILLRHCTTRLLEPRQISSLSSSITVEELLKNNAKNIFGNDPSLKEFMPTAEMFKLPEKDCFEEYFRQLMERQKKVNEMIKKIWNSMTQEEKEKMADDINKKQEEQDKKKEEQNQKPQPKPQQQPPKDGNEPTQQPQPQQNGGDKQEQDQQEQEEQNGNEDGEPEPQDNNSEPEEQDGDGDGEQEPSDPNKDNDGYKKYDNSEQALKDYFDPNGTNTMDWGSNDMFDADIKNFVDSRKDSAKSWGKYTGNVIAEIIAANQPKISYKEVIRRFRRSVTVFKTLTSRMKVNRRFDLAFPGHRRDMVTKIIFAVDVSGSMSDDDLAEGFSVINKVMKHCDMTFIQFDTEIKIIEKDFKKARKSFKVHGRGGTDFNHVLAYADENHYDGIVMFTDGYASAPKEPKTKVLWLMHSKDQKPPCNFGFVTHLERYQDVHFW